MRITDEGIALGLSMALCQLAIHDDDLVEATDRIKALYDKYFDEANRKANK